MLLPNTQMDGMTKFSCSLNKLIFDKQKKSSQIESFFNLEMPEEEYVYLFFLIVTLIGLFVAVWTDKIKIK